ncbi:MAG: HD domain-containing protein [Oscillospiraceae bacterium]
MFKLDNRREFLDCIKEIIDVPEINLMKNIPQHLTINCYEHSVFVAYVSFLLSRKFNCDYAAAARGGLLHDFFLYNWRDGEHKGVHGFAHPAIALANAEKLWELSDIEKDIISKHMWPLTPKMPKFKEAFIVNAADKICATAEILFIYRAMHVKKKLILALA